MQLLEYNLTHPYPRSRLFTTVTAVLIVLVLPILIIVNIVTVGIRIVTILERDFRENNTLPSQWKNRTSPLLPLLHLMRKLPDCQKKDFGRGDTFHLSPSLFEYKVMSAWDPNANETATKNEGRFSYSGESFSECYVYSIRFDYNAIESIQTLTVGIDCPESPVLAFLETRLVFAMDPSKNLLGQYYGYDVDFFSFTESEPQDYHRIVFGILDMIYTDSKSILYGRRGDWLLFSTRARLDWPDPFISTTIVPTNGTGPIVQDGLPEELNIYNATILNLMRAVQHAVNLDLGKRTMGNIFMNASAINSTFSPNPPPAGFTRETWVNMPTYYEKTVEEPYSTFAEMLRAGVPSNITTVLGHLNGLPEHSTMNINYLCYTYDLGTTSSLLANVFIGTATMFLSAWGAWMFVSAKVAKRVRRPCVTCTCDDLEDQSVRRDYGYAVVASGLAAGLESPPPNVITRSKLEPTLTDEKGESITQDTSTQEVPEAEPAAGTGV